jgi:hypothetical protein
LIFPSVLERSTIVYSPLRQLLVRSIKRQICLELRWDCILEIFQGSQPVLAGVDAASTYCYLLQGVEHRDGETWGWHLLDVMEQGFQPDFTIADAGTGLRAGQKEVLPDTPSQGDVFHLQQQFETVVNILNRQAASATAQRMKLEQKLAQAKLKGNYFFLRRTLAAPYLGLLQFFLNHRCFIRSAVPERVGKSPKQLMTSASHPHWLELLGVTRNPDKMDKPSTGIFRCVSRDLNTRLVHFVRVFCWASTAKLIMRRVWSINEVGASPHNL